MKVSRCRSCGRPIVWAITAAGRRMPLDMKPVDGGNVVVDRHRQPDGSPLVRVLTTGEAPDGPTWLSHFATCPNAATHRRTHPRQETPA